MNELFPGGVNSPVRAFRAVGGNPIRAARAKGPYLWDTTGRRYIDYIESWGPMILGHAPRSVVKAIRGQAKRGTSFGLTTDLEYQLGEIIQGAFPSCEMLRFVSSGTEATMSALRVARAFSKKNKIIKFDGGYHGHADCLLVKAGSGAATLGQPDSAGVPAEFAANTLIAQFNDIASVKLLFAAHPGEIAAVIVEPVMGNMGVIPARGNFLQELRTLCDTAKSPTGDDDQKTLLIFDEVISGFRVGWGGAQAMYGVRPDLTCLGKIIGGGLPVGAYGGRREIMQLIAPEGPVYQGGTLSGNPLAMAAGIAALTELKKQNPWESLNVRTKRLATGLKEILVKTGKKVAMARCGSMLTPFFMDNEPVNAAEARVADTAAFAQFWRRLQGAGILTPPSQFEAWFVSTAHSEKVIDLTLSAVEKALDVRPSTSSLQTTGGQAGRTVTE